MTPTQEPAGGMLPSVPPASDPAHAQTPESDGAGSGKARPSPGARSAPVADIPRLRDRGTSSSPLTPFCEGYGDGGEREGDAAPAVRLTGAVSPPAQDPADGGRGRDSAPSAGTSGQEWRDRVKAAESALHAAQRNGRGRYRRKTPGQRFGPGMSRRMPEPPDGGSAA